jgi:Kef-type K+ transport system membrane component KefB
MTSQQMSGLALSLVGVAALILSVGIAWSLSRVSRTRRVESASLISVVSLVLFLAGVVLLLWRHHHAGWLGTVGYSR